MAGNHDLELLGSHNSVFPIAEALRLEYQGHNLFIFHGHQMARRLRKYNPWIAFVLKYLANPLNIKNWSVSRDSGKKFRIERKIYEFSATNRIMSIIGHTHRPLFESMSKIDSIRFEIEALCRDYPEATPERQAHIETEMNVLRRDLERIIENDNHLDYRSSLYNANLVVPCLFNSGTTIGKRGMTCLEIRDGLIGLIHWFDEKSSSRYLDSRFQHSRRLDNTSFHQIIIKEDRLDYIFSKIKLLGG